MNRRERAANLRRQPLPFGTDLLPHTSTALGNASIHETTTALVAHGPNSFFQIISLPFGYGPAPAPTQGQHIGFDDDTSRCNTDAAHSHCLVKWNWNAQQYKFEAVWSRAIGASVPVDPVGALDGDGKLKAGPKNVINNGQGHARLATSPTSALLLAGNFRGELETPLQHDQDTSQPASPLEPFSNPRDDADIYLLSFTP